MLGAVFLALGIPVQLFRHQPELQDGACGAVSVGIHTGVARLKVQPEFFARQLMRLNSAIAVGAHVGVVDVTPPSVLA